MLSLIKDTLSKFKSFEFNDSQALKEAKTQL